MYEGINLYVISSLLLCSLRCVISSTTRHCFVSRIPLNIVKPRFGTHTHHINSANTANDSTGEELEDDVMVDEYGLRIPKFHPKVEKIKSQLRYFGPEIPGELWRSPQRPVGYFGRNRLDPEDQFMPSRRAIVVRARRRKYMITIYREVRKTYKRYIKDSRNYGELLYWRYKLDSLPKDSAPTKYNNFCPVSGRFRAYYRFFGLGRHPLRDFVNMGHVPGVIPANW